MFFKLHSEGKIGFKKMSDADLGLGTSHQTHIGLFGDTFTFLPDNGVEDEAILIHNDQVSTLVCYFDRIKNPDGTFRSPKIRKGEFGTASITTVIRDTAKRNPNSEWFLVWFGLENEQMVFYIFNNSSSDYQDLNSIVDFSKTRMVISQSESVFRPLLNYLESKINYNSKSIIEDLEIASQLNQKTQYRAFDLEKANRIFKDIGKQGEELVAQFLEQKKFKNEIFHYTWHNQSKESGLPYDFSIQYNNQLVVCVDVKSTGYAFDRPIIFSNNEIECICEKPLYEIYRVYDLLNEQQNPKLKVCKSSKHLANMILPKINNFEQSLQTIQTELKGAKFAISPQHQLLSFEKELILGNN